MIEVNTDSVRSGIQDRTGDAVAVDRDRLCDREGTEAAGIKAIDFAIQRGLGNGTCEGLAGRGATAGIGVISHT
jgi:hypothetical protein